METLMATCITGNGQPVPRRDLPRLPLEEFRRAVLARVAAGGRLAALFGTPEEAGLRLVAVVARAPHLHWLTTTVSESYPALTPECTQAHWFEREIAEQWGVRPEGHPWLKPVRFLGGRVGLTDFYRVEGEEVHEVAVGPVHAGVIEPGHFRFQCHGEEVLHLEISLGYQHRGVEKALVGGPDRRTLALMETLAGDTTVGHATAFCTALEGLAGVQPPPRAQLLRAVALELERLANHCGDLGALAGDVGYLPTASYCGRLRGEFLNLTALLCGSRLGRGMLRPGGVGFDAEGERIGRLLEVLESAMRDTAAAVDLLWKSNSVRTRFEDTGRVTPEVARDLGLVGPAARASGLDLDVRRDFAGRAGDLPVYVDGAGDVAARARVRWEEMKVSADLIRSCCLLLVPGPVRQPLPPLAADCAVASLVEGWRGEICHVALTDSAGRFETYKVVDPSFHNWMGLAMALRGQQISDFPLCNKSFNLSYCGHDL
jgi:Ni,Fe-hydrogenase III large subunit